MYSATQLMQNGFTHVATFGRKEMAEARAEFHRKQGLTARVVVEKAAFGFEVFSVYIKIEEA